MAPKNAFDTSIKNIDLGRLVVTQYGIEDADTNDKQHQALSQIGIKKYVYMYCTYDIHLTLYM